MRHDEKFPETIKSTQNQWATLCPDRSPEFKVHSKRGLAHSAIAVKKPYYEIAMYELKDGTWTKVYEYVLPEVCRCGRLFKETSASYGRNRYNLDPNFDGSIKDAPVICWECYKAIEQAKYDEQTKRRELKQLADLRAKYDRPIARMGGIENLTAKD